MADTKLSALTALAVEPADTDEFYINDGGASKKIAWSTVKANIVDAVEGTAILSTGEAGGTKFLREDGDGTCSWQAVSAGISEVSEDTSPTLGGDLSLGGFKLLSGASNNAIIKLGDNAGTRKFSITDSDDAEQFSVDSNGQVVIGYNATQSAFKFYSSGADSFLEIARLGTGAGSFLRIQSSNTKAILSQTVGNGSRFGMDSTHSFTDKPGANTVFSLGDNDSTQRTNTLQADLNINRDRDGAHLVLKGGAGGATNRSGGNVTLEGGANTGTGHKGYIILDLSSLPTADPSVNGALWLDTGTLSVSGA